MGDVGEGIASVLALLGMPGVISFAGGFPDPETFPRDRISSLLREFVDAGKPVAAICHAGWTLIEAGAVQGKTMTSWPSLRTDLENAGAHWVDEQVHVDGALVSSRKPDDLPAFCEQMVRAFAEAEPAVPASVGVST